MTTPPRPLYEFGPFRLDPEERLLLRGGQPVPLTPKAFDTLVVLVGRGGRLVEKAELMEAVWPDSVVEEGNLSVTISMLRKALGAGGDDRKYIETVSKRGYRFVEAVKDVPPRSGAVESVPAVQAQELTVGKASRKPRVIGLVAGLLLAGFLLVLFLLGRARRAPEAAEATPPAVRSLAVLPFKALGSAGGDEYLGIGMADTLITKLGNTGQVVVRPTSAVLKYADVAQDAQAAGREQGVDAVLDGRIQREGDRMRVTVQLVRVSDGTQLWADAFEGKPTNLFAVQDAISERAAQAIQIKLTGAEKKLMAKRFTESSEAHQAYAKGRYFWNKRTEQSLRKGIEYFQEAIALDPAYALAYAGLADSYALLSIYTVLPPRQAYPQAKEAARKALALDEGLAEAHTSLGVISFYYDWDGPAAEARFKRALEINPNYALAHMWNGLNLAAMGRLTEAAAEMKRAQEIDPLSLIVNTNVGWILYLQGQHDRAIDSYKKTIEMDQGFARARFRLGLAYEQKGMYEGAIAELQKAVSLSGGDPHYESALGHAYAAAGKATPARKLLDGLMRRSRERYVSAHGIAMIHLGLGDKERAFEWLEKALEERSYGMIFLKVDPGMAPLRSDPRLADIVRRMGL